MFDLRVIFTTAFARAFTRLIEWSVFALPDCKHFLMPNWNTPPVLSLGFAQ